MSLLKDSVPTIQNETSDQKKWKIINDKREMKSDGTISFLKKLRIC